MSLPQYWEDASDAFRDGEGTLLPLWKFQNEKAKRKHVTSICWNPEYSDLFAVGYGSFDFTRQSTGLICCYSLKNPSHPEYTFSTERCACARVCAWGGGGGVRGSYFVGSGGRLLAEEPVAPRVHLLHREVRGRGRGCSGASLAFSQGGWVHPWLLLCGLATAVPAIAANWLRLGAVFWEPCALCVRAPHGPWHAIGDPPGLRPPQSADQIPLSSPPPSLSIFTRSGVMCLDFHPQHSSLLAVGLYDGTVLVYDVRHKINKPIFSSTVKTGKHTDPVWQVYWQEEDLSKALNFFSVSSDGRVTLWTMSKSELQFQDVMELKLVGSAKDTDPDDDTSLGSLAGGCSFDFNKTSDHLFVVGTEEGRIHKCSKAYNSQYLETYKGHHMPVYALKWNYYHPRVFLSASADWTVKIWDHNNPKQVMSFDLNNAVGDAAWAPYSATVFAAVTADGKVHVFDLNENKHEPMCEQKVVRKAKLTKIAFNPKHPIVLLGDDRGCVTSLKLSPNLRKALAATPPSGKTAAEWEVDKLNKIIDIALKGESA